MPECLKELGRFLYYVAPSLVGTITAALLTSVLIQKYFVSRANQAGVIDALIKDLETLRSDSLEYWMIDPRDLDEQTRRDKQEKLLFLGNKLKGAIRSLAGDLRFLSERDNLRKFHDITASLLDACTGGTFESAGRAPDPGRYFIIVNAVNAAKSTIRRLKL